MPACLGSARVPLWPFEGWEIPTRRSALVEVYPSLWSCRFPREDRTPDQQDAYAVAAWMRHADHNGSLAEYLNPNLEPADREEAQIEGWILGVAGFVLDG